MAGGPGRPLSSAGTIHTVLQRLLTAPLLKKTIHQHTHIAQILSHLQLYIRKINIRTDLPYIHFHSMQEEGERRQICTLALSECRLLSTEM